MDPSPNNHLRCVGVGVTGWEGWWGWESLVLVVVIVQGNWGGVFILSRDGFVRVSRGNTV